MSRDTDQPPGGAPEAPRGVVVRFPQPAGLCPGCEGSGLMYASRRVHGRTAVGVTPCTECEAGARRHIQGGVCVWARGSRPCVLCGALEGEQVPYGWRPEAPPGWIPYRELPGWTGEP